MLGLGHALGQHWVYDQHYGVPLAKRFYQTASRRRFSMRRRTCSGRRSTFPIRRRRSVRAAWAKRRSAPASALVNAIAAAVGDEVFRRAPVTADMILHALEAGRPMHEPLTANI